MSTSVNLRLFLFSCFCSCVAAMGVDPRMGEIERLLPDDFKTLGAAGVQSAIRVFDTLTRASESPMISNGRLTLTSSTPATTSDVTAATLVYFTPYAGNRIVLYSGTTWQLLSFTEKSVSVPSTTNTPFDVFAYNNSGTVALEAVSWTNDTTRATALTTQDGVYVKSGATTRRYLGTGRTTSVSGQTEDSALRRFLWNYYNRKNRTLFTNGSGLGYTYTLSTWRPVNNDTANRVEVVIGVAQDALSLICTCVSNNTSGYASRTGIGQDNIVNDSGNPGFAAIELTSNTARFSGFPTAGYHYYQMMEYASPPGTTTWYCGAGYGYLMGSIDG